MSQYGHPVEWLEPPMGAALVGRFALARGTRYGTHTHDTHQLAWARSGVVTHPGGGHDVGAAAEPRASPPPRN